LRSRCGVFGSRQAGVQVGLERVSDGPGALQVESPHTSQGLLLWLTVPAKNETHWFMLNQTSIDATGELTAPMPVALELAIDFLGVRSNELAFAIDQGGC
jgi:hypothetical protein